MSDEMSEHSKRIEEMKAAEARVREWLEGFDFPARPAPRLIDVRLLLERIDAYEASITWHTDCLTCPKLFERLCNLDLAILKFMELFPEFRTDPRFAEVLKARDT